MRVFKRLILFLMLSAIFVLQTAAADNPHDHVPEVIPGYPADCFREGRTDGLKCSLCGEILSAQEIIPALAHYPVTIPGRPASCRQSGLTDGIKCKLCGTVLVQQNWIPAIACPSAHLSDVGKNAWYHDAVDYMVLRGVMTGTGGGKFEPTKNLIRAELVQVFYNISGVKWPTGRTSFIDVPETAWYAKAVAWASFNHIVNGTGKTTFSPKEYASREMVFTILYRFAGGSPMGKDYLTKFRDGASVSAWAKDAVNWAVGNGYVHGSGGYLNPGNRITRAELAQLMTNYLRVQEDSYA